MFLIGVFYSLWIANMSNNVVLEKRNQSLRGWHRRNLRTSIVASAWWVHVIFPNKFSCMRQIKNSRGACLLPRRGKKDQCYFFFQEICHSFWILRSVSANISLESSWIFTKAMEFMRAKRKWADSAWIGESCAHHMELQATISKSKWCLFVVHIYLFFMLHGAIL